MRKTEKIEMGEIQKWKTLDSRLVLDSPWCRVRQDTVKLSNGQVIDDYFVHVRPEIVLIVPITEDGNIVFVRQYRHGIGKVLLELPAGRIDSQEDAITAAARELEEETGYIAESLTLLKTIYENPVKDTNSIHIFLAENVSPIGSQNLDITEDIEVVLIPQDAVMEKIATGEICVSGTITALFLAFNYDMKCNG